MQRRDPFHRQQISRAKVAAAAVARRTVSSDRATQPENTEEADSGCDTVRVAMA
jgi:hypothetical protein